MRSYDNGAPSNWFCLSRAYVARHYEAEGFQSLAPATPRTAQSDPNPGAATPKLHTVQPGFDRFDFVTNYGLRSIDSYD